MVHTCRNSITKLDPTEANHDRGETDKRLVEGYNPGRPKGKAFRNMPTGSLPRCLAIATIVASVVAVPVRTVPAVAAGANDPVAAGPAGWAGDLSPIAASDW